MDIRKISIMLLTCILISFVMVACADDTDPISKNNDSIETSADVTESETTETHSLPNDLDFGGESVNFMIVDNSFDFYTSKEIYSEEQNGELFNDSVYERNIIVEELLNVEIKATPIASASAYSTAQKSLTAGDTEYDVVMPYMNETIQLAQTGLLYDLNMMKYIDLDKFWWDQRANENLMINGKIFITTGDISILDNECTMVMFFNKKLISDFNLENPYELVTSNKWTIDKVFEMGAAVTGDINGDGKLDNNDRWGLSIAGNAPHSMYFGSGERISKTIDGEVQLTMDNPRGLNVIDKIFTHLENPDILTNRTGDIGYETVDKMFNEGRVMMVTFALVDINGLRNAEFEFGILPYPLYEESQESYNNLISTGLVSSTSVPYNCVNPDKVSATLEAMAFYSVDTLTVAYYDNALKLRYARDNESGDMLDIIFQTRVYDIAYIFNWGGIGGLLESMYNGKRNNFASEYAKIEEKATAKMHETIELFDAIK